MKNTNENQCLFSIKLENGIVITGENPIEVMDFILDFRLAANDSVNYWTKQAIDEKFLSVWVDLMESYESMFHDALDTINHYYKK